MRLKPSPRSINLLLLISLLLPLSALALTTDQDQPINIEADTADLDDNAGTTIYRGNVIVTQGSLRLTGDTVTVFSPGRTLKKVIAEGNPARFRQRQDNKNEDMRAQSRIMTYLVDEEKLVLREDAHLWQGKDEISGNRIDYDLKTEIGKAIRGEKERVKVIIQPRAKTQPSTPAEPAQP